MSRIENRIKISSSVAVFTLSGRKCVSGRVNGKMAWRQSVQQQQLQRKWRQWKDDFIENNKGNVPGDDRKRVKKIRLQFLRGSASFSWTSPVRIFPPLPVCCNIFFSALHDSQVHPWRLSLAQIFRQSVWKITLWRLLPSTPWAQFPQEVANRGLNLKRLLEET